MSLSCRLVRRTAYSRECGLPQDISRQAYAHMKRTTFMLDEHLLEELTRVSGERTYSRAVTKAMEDYLRRHRAGRILELAGSGLWEGGLAEMRADAQLERPTREELSLCWTGRISNGRSLSAGGGVSERDL